ncbi:MAG: hypothetical protein ACFB51_21770 [Anaerolineae bacterium]
MLTTRGYLIYLIERDVYARQALIGFLSWDRRTRVTGTARSVLEMITNLTGDLAHQRLDVVMLDTSLASSEADLIAQIEDVQAMLPQVDVICLGHDPVQEASWITAARDAGARAYLIRERVGAGIANAVRYALECDFVVTNDLGDLEAVDVLPGRRRYPRLTRRIEQALQLCVVEGLPAELAAEEMGVSTSTVRSYVKEGYRILEAHDDTIYPDNMSPVERAFLRYTALDLPTSEYWSAA